MIKRILIVVLLLSATINAQQSGQALVTTNSQSSILNAFADEAITIDATAGGVGFTAAKINPTCTDCIPFSRAAQRADCTTEYSAGINIRATVTGTVVTASVGTLIVSGTTFTVFGYTNIAAFKAIRTASTSVAMYCTYSRTP